jgi:glycosyltransferase involved in cell wall biosynthesis
MRVAVVTPYFQEEDGVLRQCLDSVAAQAHKISHILVADGFPKDWAAHAVDKHIVLPGNGHGDNGNLGRCVGAMTAVAEGFDAIAFLDADNWYQPNHIASLVALQRQTGVALCTAGRSLHRPDGSLLLANDTVSDGVHFADTSCLLYFRGAFGLLPLWGLMPRQFSSICDRVMWSAVVARAVPRAHSGLPTMAFRTLYSAHYHHAGEPPPANCKDPGPIREKIELWHQLPEWEKRRIQFGA